MVQRMQAFDDFDGSEAAETVRYSYDGRDFEIDLSEEHAREFDEFLAKYIEHSRKVERAQPEPQPRQRRARRSGGERRSPEELHTIRQWARAQGFQVSDRGRIKADILEKYDAAH